MSARILVADDIESNRYLLVSLFTASGYEVEVASDGAEALASALKRPPDLIVTDVLMPVMDGFELCRRWRQEPLLAGIPFVVYTATYTDPRDEALALSLGADRYLIKPQKVEVLLQVVHEVLGGAGRGSASGRTEPVGEPLELALRHNEVLLGKLEKKITQLEAEISLRDTVERELRDAALRWQGTFDSMLDPVALIRPDGTITRANRAMAEYLGIPSGELVGKRCFQLFHGVDQHIEGCPLVASRKSGLRETMEMTVGEKTYFVVTDPLPGPGDEAEGYIHILRDITWHKRSEAALLESASLMRIAGRAARLGGWSVELGTMRATWSDEVAAIHGMPPGTSPSADEGIAFYAPEWRDRIREVFEACVHDGVPYDEEMEIITAGGRRIWVRTIGEAIRDAAGAVVKVQGAFQEITERKLAEEERRRLQNQLLMSQKLESIGRLAGGVAHDFNNLLSVVLGYTGFALEAVREGDPLREDLEEIRRAGERAAALTRQLLAFSRKQILEPEVLSLNRVVGGLENMLRRLLGEDVEVHVGLAGDLGNALADPGQIEQVIMNLAINARDAMPQGGRLTVETANVFLDEEYTDMHLAIRPGRYVMLSVTDSGSGMDDATREHIFEPFFTTKEKDKGTGLGLSIVYGIVKQSGGYIWVYSEPGQGTTFKIYLPRVDEAEAAVERVPVRSATGEETVLIVEDEPAVRRIAERILLRAGYQVVTATSPEEALLLGGKLGCEVSLLLTDVVMPRIDGGELASRLTSVCPGLRTLFMSGYADLAIVRNHILLPGKHFICKPFSAADLTARVREVLDG